jgi:uncharacterized membrane protein YdjX (TVP38/TMEM64 family)
VHIEGVRRQSDHWPGWIGLAGVLVGGGILAAVILTVPALRDAAGSAIAGDAGALRRQLRDLGFWSLGVILVLMLVHVVVWYPSEIVTATAGFVYGFSLAMPIVLGGWLISALSSYALGRYAGRPLLHRIAGQRRFERAERVIERGGWPLLMAARLVPIVPFSLVGYVAGATRTSVWTFAWTTVVGFIPLSIIVTLLGSRLHSLSIDDPVLWLALVPAALLVLAGRPLLRGLRLDGSPEAPR